MGRKQPAPAPLRSEWDDGDEEEALEEEEEGDGLLGEEGVDGSDDDDVAAPGGVDPVAAARLTEAQLEALPAGVPSYLRAAVGPPRTTAPRKWCSVCGFRAPSACPRCGQRLCSRRCGLTHAETRCLRFVV